MNADRGTMSRSVLTLEQFSVLSSENKLYWTTRVCVFCDVYVEGRGEPRAGVISSSSGCSGLQEAFTVLLTYLLGVLGMASHAVFCCSHRMPDVGDAYRITQFSRLQIAKSTTQASGEDSHGCLLTWSLEAKGEVPVFRRVTCIRLEEESSQTDLPGATPIGLGPFLRDSPFMTVES